MEHIRQAVERARAGVQGAEQAEAAWSQPQTGAFRPPALEGQFRQVTLDEARLEYNRIIAHDPADARVKSYDMMRTQILQSMDLKEWQLMAVTSPTPSCG